MKGLQGTEIKQDVDQGVASGNGLKAALTRMVNAERIGLRVDPFGGGALFKDAANQADPPLPYYESQNKNPKPS